MPRYAEKTEVSCEKSQAEIRAIIGRYGATRYATLDEPGRAAIMFEVQNRRIRFTLPLPDVADSQFDSITTGAGADARSMRVIELGNRLADKDGALLRLQSKPNSKRL